MGRLRERDPGEGAAATGDDRVTGAGSAARSAARRRAGRYPRDLLLLYFCWKRSTRPAVSRNRCFPVKKG